MLSWTINLLHREAGGHDGADRFVTRSGVIDALGAGFIRVALGDLKHPHFGGTQSAYFAAAFQGKAPFSSANAASSSSCAFTVA